MDYKRVYDELIERGVKRGWTKKSASCYTERHHILPKSMGGSNKKDNLVELTAREHYIAHWLLYKIHKTREMACAWSATTMDRDGDRKLTSRQFERARIIASDNMKGENHPLWGTRLSEERKRAIGDFHRGKKMSNETVAKMVEGHKGYCHSEESKKKIGDGNRGKVLSEETRAKISISKLGKVMTYEARKNMSKGQKDRHKIKLMCPHCLAKVCDVASSFEKHFDNCPKNPICSDYFYSKYGYRKTEKTGMVIELLEKDRFGRSEIIEMVGCGEVTYKRAIRHFNSVNNTVGKKAKKKKE